jgi:hypothetical protein
MKEFGKKDFVITMVCIGVISICSFFIMDHLEG